MATRFSLATVLRVRGSDGKEIERGLEQLADAELLVGFPEETTVREEAGAQTISNAALGYIHDNGAPEQNIPARPFMLPAIESVKDRVERGLARIARHVVVDRTSAGVEPGLHAVGSIAELAIKNKINEGIPPPLAESTLRQRAKRVKGGRYAETTELRRRAEGFPASTLIAKPLIDTGDMRNAVRYVIRRKRDRK